MLLHTLLMAAGTQQQGPDGLFFIGGTTDFTDQGTFTSSKTTTGLSIGTPFPDRKIIAAAKLATTFHGGGGNAAFDSLTLDGTAMTLVATAKAASAEDIVGIFQMHKENGTSADFVMSCKNSSTGSALNYHSGGLAIYTTYGKATSAHDTETVNSSTSPLDAEITCEGGGVIVAVGGDRGDDPDQSTFNNLTKDVGAVCNSLIISASLAPATTQTNLDIDYSFDEGASVGSGCVAAVSWSKA